MTFSLSLLHHLPWAPISWIKKKSLNPHTQSHIYIHKSESEMQPQLCCCCSVANLCLTLCNPMDCSTPGLCLSPSPGVCPSSCPLNLWCHPTVSSFVSLLSFCLQSFPASASFPVSQLFADCFSRWWKISEQRILTNKTCQKIWKEVFGNKLMDDIYSNIYLSCIEEVGADCISGSPTELELRVNKS